MLDEYGPRCGLYLLTESLLCIRVIQIWEINYNITGSIISPYFYHCYIDEVYSYVTQRVNASSHKVHVDLPMFVRIFLVLFVELLML